MVAADHVDVARGSTTFGGHGVNAASIFTPADFLPALQWLDLGECGLTRHHCCADTDTDFATAAAFAVGAFGYTAASTVGATAATAFGCTTACAVGH